MGCKRLHGVQNRQFLPKNLKNPHIFKDFWLFSRFGGVHGVHGVHLYTPLDPTEAAQWRLLSLQSEGRGKSGRLVHQSLADKSPDRSPPEHAKLQLQERTSNQCSSPTKERRPSQTVGKGQERASIPHASSALAGTFSKGRRISFAIQNSRFCNSGKPFVQNDIRVRNEPLTMDVAV